MIYTRALMVIIVTLACCLPSNSYASAIVGAGLGSPNGHYIPPISPAINLVCGPGDSITFGYTTSNPPTTSWCNQAASLITTAGYTITTTNIAQTGSASWQWAGGGLGANPAGYFVGGKRNVVAIDLGTNDLSIQNIYSTDWFNNVTYPLTGHVRGSMGAVSAVATGATTTITLAAGITANRIVGEYVQVDGTGIAGLDAVCAQIASKTSTQLTLSVVTSGGTSTGTAHLCASSAAGDLALFAPSVAGAAASSGPPSWVVAGGTTDGTVTWGVPINLARVLTDLEANIYTIATAWNAAGFAVLVTPLLPRNSGMVLPQTRANQETQRLAFNAWLVTQVGTHGIKAIQRWDLDANMAAPGLPASLNGTYYSDGVHPNDFGSAYLASIWGKQGIYDALHP